MEKVEIDKLEKMRDPFPDNQIGKLAKGSKAQTQCQNDQKRNCAVCGGFHHPGMIHLDYVGHAALTDRLLDVDPLWHWEPLAFNERGLPAFDETGGLWIRLTVCGHTRIGYGNAAESQYKEVGSREKEVIGDALRNAAMRFGAALELWHKGDLHQIEPDDDAPPEPQNNQSMSPENVTKLEELCGKIRNGKARLLAYAKVSSINDIPAEKFFAIKKLLNQIADSEGGAK